MVLSSKIAMISMHIYYILLEHVARFNQLARNSLVCLTSISPTCEGKEVKITAFTSLGGLLYIMQVSPDFCPRS